MQSPKVCLCLTGKSLAEDLALLNKYRKWIDIAELRVDYLTDDERLYIRHFPELSNLPCILTIRRQIDGGKYIEGEAARTVLFARGLAYANQDIRKNFAYIDLEEDFQVPSLQDAALAFGTRVIRSFHKMDGVIPNIAQKLIMLRTTGYEIPKVSCMPQTLSDVTQMFCDAKGAETFEHIICAMGPLGLPSRILAQRLGSFLSYTSPPEMMKVMSHIGHIDPVTLNDIYNFKNIDAATKLYGITGWPLSTTASPEIHNNGYRNHGMNAVYFPIRSESIEETLDFADQIGINGLSVTVPYKEAVLHDLQQISELVGEIGACNTIMRRGADWHGFNTDANGLKNALQKFLGVKSLYHKKVAIIGAGGAAKAAAWVVKQLRGSACIFNRTPQRGRALAELYGFKWAILEPDSTTRLEEFSDLIIQTTAVGMNSTEPSSQANDPLYFYSFNGHESVYDVIYTPEITPLLLRAKNAGCQWSNGYSMLQNQAYEQFKLFTGEEY